MHILENGRLSVELLDPLANRARLGTRFCHGGYIWQIRDRAGTALLAGPEWPEANPDVFNGQGVPEVLRHSELITGRPLTHDGARGIIPGVGVARWSEGKPELIAPAEWAITREAAEIHFDSEQRDGAWGIEVRRSIELSGGVVISRTRVRNTGTRGMPLHWFAHPFFPLDGEGLAGAELGEGVSMPENTGFALEGRLLRSRRRFLGKDDGHFQKLEIEWRAPFAARIRHPVTDWVACSATFAPDEIYVWANGNTFSIEPYLLAMLAPGESRSWRLDYEFGTG